MQADLFGHKDAPVKTKAAKAVKPKPPVALSEPNVALGKPRPFTWLKDPRDKWTTIIWHEGQPL